MSSSHHHSSKSSGSSHSSGHSHSKSSSGSSKKKRKFKHSLRRPMGHTISVLLTFFTFVFFTLIAILCSAFSKSYIVSAVTSPEYIAQVYEAQIVESTALASDFNLPKNVFNNVITQDSLTQHLTEYTEAVLNGSSASIDLTPMQNTLKSNIEITVKDSGLKFDKTKEAMASNVVLHFGEKYFELLEIPGLSSIMSVRIPFIIIFVICEILLALLIPICALLIDKTHRNSHKTTRQLAYSFLGAGILTLAVPLAIKAMNMYSTLQVSREYVYNFFITYFDHIMNVWMIFAIIPLAMGAGFIFWTRYRKNKLKVKE